MLQRSGYTISSLIAVLITFGFVILAATDQRAETTVGRKFDFGPGALQHGYLRVTEKSIYNPEIGYGFEPGAQITCIDRSGKDDLAVMSWRNASSKALE